MSREFVVCEKCGKRVVSNNKYCTNCGVKLPTPPNPPKRKFPIVIILVVIILILAAYLSYSIFLYSSNMNKYADNNLTNSESNNNLLDLKSDKKIMDFGDFKMTVNKNSSFYNKNSPVPYANADRDWKDNTSDVSVYFWKNKSSEDVIKSLKMGTIYTDKNINRDNNLIILTSPTYDKSRPTFYDFMVGVESKNGVVFVQGSNIEILKEYAKSIEFSK